MKIKKFWGILASITVLGAVGMIKNNTVEANPNPVVSIKSGTMSAEELHHQIAENPEFQAPVKRLNLRSITNRERINQFIKSFWDYISCGKKRTTQGALASESHLGEEFRNERGFIVHNQDFRGFNEKYGFNLTYENLVTMFDYALDCPEYDFPNRVQHQSANYGLSRERKIREGQQNAFDVANTVIVQLADLLIKKYGLVSPQAIKTVFDEITFFRFLIQKASHGAQLDDFLTENSKRSDPLTPETKEQEQYLQLFMENKKTSFDDNSDLLDDYSGFGDVIYHKNLGPSSELAKAERAVSNSKFTDYDNIIEFYNRYISPETKTSFNEEDAKRHVLRTFYYLTNSNIYLRGQGTTSTIFARALMYSAGFHIKNVRAWHHNSPLFIPVFEALINCGRGMSDTFVKNNLRSIELIPQRSSEEMNLEVDQAKSVANYETQQGDFQEDFDEDCLLDELFSRDGEALVEIDESDAL